MTPHDGVPGTRAHILATEHWSLLATRSQTWSEVMGRITAQFTFASASLVGLALTVQVVGVSGPFRLLAIGLGLSVLLTGSLTALRVRNASQEDLMLVAGMNRLRTAYIALDPWIKEYLVTGWTEDASGISRTYTPGIQRTGSSHLWGSAFVFVATVNVIVAAGLGAVMADTMGAADPVTVISGGFAALLYAGLVVRPAHCGYQQTTAPRVPQTGSDSETNGWRSAMTPSARGCGPARGVEA